MAYLVGLFCAEPETPRFVIPIKIDYEYVHVNEELVLDFSMFDDLAATVRIALDVLFCACLIAGTRSLIRG